MSNVVHPFIICVFNLIRIVINLCLAERSEKEQTEGNQTNPGFIRLILTFTLS